ncbi:MAG: ribosome small subunit-dependent GTPase A [Treponema sp.]|nr:ribosome small subunit-dependent GTPase A [Treponema sp.]
MIGEKANVATGVVFQGSRNIFTVRPDGSRDKLECRLKGKILKGAEGFYNPLAPGDRVSVHTDPEQPGSGMIVALEERRNLFSRFNQKGGCSQLLAANVDQVLCITTRRSPPFRPRFLDRVLLQADIAGIHAVIVCNKTDLDDGDCEDRMDADERLEDFRRIGYEIIEVSAKTGRGLDSLRRCLAGKRSVLMGQSGVGKSSILNALAPGLNIRTGAINGKYDRGNHTTTLASMVDLPELASGFPENTLIIDTPGMRRFVPDRIDKGELIVYMREFALIAGKCTYGLSCSHRHEPGCKIMEAVHAGVIHEDRYESFLRIFDELAGNNNVD